MITHLHLHLEPNERKRRQLGIDRVAYSSAKDFFDEHKLDNTDRLAISLSDLPSFIHNLHGEQRAQDVKYVELRFSPRRFTNDGEQLSVLLPLVSGMALQYSEPVIRLILLINRDSPSDYIKMIEDALIDGLPMAFVGLDLAGDETRYPDVNEFERCFSLARSAGLGVTVHAGEFGGAEHIWMALDRLGANRIGHGTAAGGQRALAARLRNDGILVEVSLTSNLGLGAVKNPSVHPLRWFLANGVAVSLNSDIPLHLGTTLADERRLAVDIIGSDSNNFFEYCAMRHRFG
jgi:adenosine deaminase